MNDNSQKQCAPLQCNIRPLKNDGWKTYIFLSTGLPSFVSLVLKVGPGEMRLWAKMAQVGI